MKEKCKICGMKTFHECSTGYDGEKKPCCEPCAGKFGNKIEEALDLGTYGKDKVLINV